MTELGRLDPVKVADAFDKLKRENIKLEAAKVESGLKCTKLEAERDMLQAEIAELKRQAKLKEKVVPLGRLDPARVTDAFIKIQGENEKLRFENKRLSVLVSNEDAIALADARKKNTELNKRNGKLRAAITSIEAERDMLVKALEKISMHGATIDMLMTAREALAKVGK